jgi:hypothetical protein
MLTTTIVAPPSNASKWQMGFNSAFKGLMMNYEACQESKDTSGVGKLFMLIMATLPSTLILYL